MTKLNEYTFITLGSFPVLNFNGEGADATISGVESVSLCATRFSSPDNEGEIEWCFEAKYHRDILKSEFDRLESVITVYESVLVSDLNEFVFAFAHLAHNLNNTTLANRCGYFALKVDNLTREDIRSSLLVNYGISE